MRFSLEKSLEILEATPVVLLTMLQDLSAEWTRGNEGEGTWSPFDVVGHLIHGEKTDWIPRAEIILSENMDKRFVPFDRFAQFEDSGNLSLPELLNEFVVRRKTNIEILRSKNLTEEDLSRKGIHPVFGEVTLEQLLATWVVHDLNHISQISRVMAKQYKQEVGPWIEYLRILQ